VLGAQAVFGITHSSHLSKFDQTSAGFLAIVWLGNGD
jgi:hypothetical protein